jgi:SAM-dependent methyltransferase
MHDMQFHTIYGTEIITYPAGKYAKTTICDCEYIINPDGKKIVLIFDVMVIDDRNVMSYGIEQRITNIPAAITLFTKHTSTDLIFMAKTYHSLAAPLRYKTVFVDMYKTDRGYENDGLILVKTGQAYMRTTALKWKPVEKQTIDFLLKKCPDSFLGKDDYVRKPDHTLYLLYTTASINLANNLHIQYNRGYQTMFPDIYGHLIIPVPFVPPNVPLAYLYYHPQSNPNNNLDSKIVELTCSTECVIYNDRKYTVNWEYVKTRDDRIVIPNKDYGNGYLTAFYSFINHIEPFNFESLYNMQTYDHYFLNRGNNVYIAMKAYMSYVKHTLISGYANKSKSVLDIGSGEGQDLFRYMQNGVEHLMVVDKNKPALTALLKRWLSTAKMTKTKMETALSAVVVDVNDPVDSNIERIKSVSPVDTFNNIFSNHAIHYFAESLDTIRNFAKLCERMTSSGSYIVFTCPFGDEVFEKLKDTGKWDHYEHDVLKYSVHSMYTDKTMLSSGQKAKWMLPFSAGKYYEEYLVNVDTFKEIFEEQHMRLILKKSMGSYMDGFSTNNSKRFVQLTKGDIAHINLYGVLVFQRE